MEWVFSGTLSAPLSRHGPKTAATKTSLLNVSVSDGDRRFLHFSIFLISDFSHSSSLNLSLCLFVMRNRFFMAGAKQRGVGARPRAQHQIAGWMPGALPTVAPLLPTLSPEVGNAVLMLQGRYFKMSFIICFVFMEPDLAHPNEYNNC